MFKKDNTDIDLFENIIIEFGGEKNNKKKYILRKNVNDKGNFPDKGAYFGCINEGEEPIGTYSDLSIVVFPSNEENDSDDRWIIALVVGSLGYKNDYSLASLPGTRRLFLNSLDVNSFVKNDFLDINSEEGFKDFYDKLNLPNTLNNSLKNYKKVILAATVVKPNIEGTLEEIFRLYLALYASLRSWPNNINERKAVNRCLCKATNCCDDKEVIEDLLKNRKYIVLQGAPGTGKTRMAKDIAKGHKVFFTQFHAESTYSDFIYGILPVVDSNNLSYVTKEGIFVSAIKYSMKNPNENVYLIIDEINRANLSNVLGGAFYLFEPKMDDFGVDIEVCPGLTLTKLPENLYVIATMNTADRSLAVIDFALRRRFAWYTLYPHEISIQNENLYFCRDEFNEISQIFTKYATDEELNLQPGHAYYIVDNSSEFNEVENEIKKRLEYEIMPLIKEYLADGMLSIAKDTFVNYFRGKIGKEMFV